MISLYILKKNVNKSCGFLRDTALFRIIHACTMYVVKLN